MANPVLALMAAGMGSRFGGLKQLQPVDDNGHLLMDFSVYDALRAGFRDIVFIIKRENLADFEGTVGCRIRGHANIAYAFQDMTMLPPGVSLPMGRAKPLGTTHAVLCAAEAIAGRPFAAINADDYYGPAGFRLVYEYLSQPRDTGKAAWAMVGFLLGNTVSENGSVSRGVCVTDAEGDIVSVTERTRIETYEGGIHYTEDDGASWTDLPADAIVSMNLWGFTNEFLQEAQAGFAAFLQKNLPVNPLKCEYYLPSVVTAALVEGKAAVHVLTSTDKWYGITYREDKPALVEALRRMSAEGLYPQDKLF